MNLLGYRAIRHLKTRRSRHGSSRFDLPTKNSFGARNEK